MQKSGYSTKQALYRLINFYITTNDVYRDIDPHFKLYNPIKSYYGLKYVADKLDWLLTNRLPIFLNKRVLDIGCGTGEHAYMLQEYATTIDIWDANPVFIKACNKLFSSSNQIKVIEKSQITTNTYDTIFTSGVLELLDNYIEWLQNIIDNCEFKHLVIIAKPDQPNTPSPAHDRQYRIDNNNYGTYTEHNKIIQLSNVKLLEYHTFPIYTEKLYKHDKYVYIFKKI